MNKTSLEAMIRELNAKTDGRRDVAARTVYGGHEASLRQTLVVIKKGGTLDEHESPGEATITVLDGRIELFAGKDSWIGRRGDLLIIPDARHSVTAHEDSAFLLTVAVRG